MSSEEKASSDSETQDVRGRAEAKGGGPGSWDGRLIITAARETWEGRYSLLFCGRHTLGLRSEKSRLHWLWTRSFHGLPVCVRAQPLNHV